MAKIARITSNPVTFPNITKTITWTKNDASLCTLFVDYGTASSDTDQHNIGEESSISLFPNLCYGQWQNKQASYQKAKSPIEASELWQKLGVSFRDDANTTAYLGNVALNSMNQAGNSIYENGDEFDYGNYMQFPAIHVTTSAINYNESDTISYSITKSSTYSGYMLNVKAYSMSGTLYEDDPNDVYVPLLNDPLVQKTISTNTNANGSFSFNASELQSIYDGVSSSEGLVICVIRMTPLYGGKRPMYWLQSQNSNGEDVYTHRNDDGLDVNCCFYLHLARNNPTFSSFTYADTNAETIGITGDSNYLVQGSSHLVVTIPSSQKAQSNNESAMSRYVCTFNGVSKTASYSDSEDVVIDMGNPSASVATTLTVAAYDSFGLHTDVSKVVQCLPYKTPSLNVVAARQDGYETATTITVQGSYSPLTISGDKKNSLSTLSYRYITYDDDEPTWTDPVDLLPTTIEATDGSFMTSNFVIYLEVTKTYTVEFTFHDQLGNPTSVINKTISIGVPIFFIDSKMKSVGLNIIPSESDVFDVGGGRIIDVGGLSATGDIQTTGKVISGPISTNGLHTISSTDGSALTLKQDGGASINIGADSAGPRIWTTDIYHRHYTTTGGTYSVVMTSSGTLGVDTSASRFKENIEYNVSDEYAKNLLKLDVATWRDKLSDEMIAKSIQSGEDVDFDGITSDRGIGLIAEDLEKNGLSAFVRYETDDTGHKEPVSIAYDRLSILFIPILKKYIHEFDGRISLLEQAKDNILLRLAKEG